MDFYEVLEQVQDLLRQRGRVAYRVLKLQWEEGGIAPQVVFEIRSPGNTIAMMTRKFRFCERHGVEEYYLYDPAM